LSSRATLIKWMDEFEIPRREVGSNKRRKRGLGYGQKVRKGENVEHKRELANIELMKELKSQGKSYREIADRLNELKVPTKTKKGRWHGKTVYQILQRAD